MTDQPAPSVTRLLAELHAFRVANLAPAYVQANIDQRRHLEAAADRAAWVKPGDVIEPFVLPEVLGGTVDLTQLLEAGPVVLLFFRFANCPACNISLRHYQQELYPALVELGATLVAVSPQVPEKLAAIRNRFGFGFPVASDSSYQLTRSLGITFVSARPEQQERDRAAGGGLAAELGTGQWELPYPTIVVLDQRGVVTFADVHPDWLIRTEAAPVIEAVRALVQVTA